MTKSITKLKKIEKMQEQELLLELIRPLAQMQQNKEELNHVQVQLAQITRLLLDLSKKFNN